MAVNRIQAYFRTEEVSFRIPSTPVDQLMSADLNFFPDTLKSIVKELISNGNPVAISRFCDQLLVPCFHYYTATGGFMFDEFRGDEEIANQSMRTAAAFYALGWERLNPNARVWCRTMLSCEMPSDLPHPARKDVANAKIFVGFMTNYSAQKPRQIFSLSETEMQFVDPFIGL